MNRVIKIIGPNSRLWFALLTRHPSPWTLELEFHVGVAMLELQISRGFGSVADHRPSTWAPMASSEQPHLPSLTYGQLLIVY